MRSRILFLCLFASALFAQEAPSGFELRTTLSASSFYAPELDQPPRDGAEVAGGIRALFYPIWKLNSHWSISAAVQVHSRPYFQEEFTTQGYGLKADLLQLTLNYTRVWSHNRSVVARVGQMSSAFGAFLQRYDSADNPLIQVPPGYGYYYQPVTFQGLAGAQVDATAGKFDARAQFVNSSPSNRRSIFDRDQYGNWAGGAGITLRQGFRVGGSAFYGPYLDRNYAFFFPGEANPRDLPGRGYGLDVQWGAGHWNAWGEVQHFQMDYRAIPTFTENTGYAEVRRILSPRWYAAGRVGYLRASAFPSSHSYEFAAGYRPAANQLVKLGYIRQQGALYPGSLGNTLAVEYVTWFRVLSVTGN